MTNTPALIMRSEAVRESTCRNFTALLANPSRCAVLAARLLLLPLAALPALRSPTCRDPSCAWHRNRQCYHCVKARGARCACSSALTCNGERSLPVPSPDQQQHWCELTHVQPPARSAS